MWQGRCEPLLHTCTLAPTARSIDIPRSRSLSLSSLLVSLLHAPPVASVRPVVMLASSGSKSAAASGLARLLAVPWYVGLAAKQHRPSAPSSGEAAALISGVPNQPEPTLSFVGVFPLPFILLYLNFFNTTTSEASIP